MKSIVTASYSNARARCGRNPTGRSIRTDPATRRSPTSTGAGARVALALKFVSCPVNDSEDLSLQTPLNLLTLRPRTPDGEPD